MLQQGNVRLMVLAVMFMANIEVSAQEVKSRNAQSWELAGSIQLQHLYNTDIANDALRTNNGFRMRRGRFTARGKVSNFVETAFQFEMRDNSPRLKDAEGKIKLGNDYYVRLGQFKVPVWREELRSSTNLFLVERSAAADFLIGYNFSARQIGVELGRRPSKGLQIAVNVANGAGEGVREDAGQNKNNFVNNGKLLTGRANLLLNEHLQIGVSGAANRITATNQTPAGTAALSGTNTMIAPDFGIYLHRPSSKSQVDIEGGLAYGALAKELFGATEGSHFLVADVSGRYTAKFEHANASLGGLDAVELAGGVSYVEPNNKAADESLVFRFGPAFCFGKSTRLQINGEVTKPVPEGAETVFQIRSQANFNF